MIVSRSKIIYQLHICCSLLQPIKLCCIKYRQDNLHRMTWYTGTCGIMAMGLLYMLVLWSMCVYYMGLWIYWFCDHGATILNGSVTIGRISLVGAGHPRSDSVVLLMLRTVCCAKAGVLALYYRSLGTAPTLLRNGNILSRPYYWTMTATHIICICSLSLYIYHL